MSNPELKGVVEKITYRNDENGYTVFKLKAGKEHISCVGSVAVINEGDSVVLNGRYSTHSVYGEQFNITSFEILPVKSALQILKFLSSGAIKGIGPATALKIVERFKEDSLDVIENYPLELTAIKGISKEKALAISNGYQNQVGIREIMLSLSAYNINPLEATSIYKVLGNRSAEIIKEDPFVLCKEGINFSFDRVEEISENLGIPIDSDSRICAGIIHILKKNLSNGHTCLPYDKLLEVACEFLSVNKIIVEDSIKLLEGRMQITIKEYCGVKYVFLFDYYSAEEFSAAKIKAMASNNMPLYDLSSIEIKLLENKLGFSFDERQIEAVKDSLKSNIFVLTGRPGTGKTTTLNAMISILSGRDKSIALAAPTGRAAKRITELTGVEAKTIHRLLEAELTKDGKHSFGRNSKRPLDEDVIIIDEMSMVDTLLFKALLEAVRVTSRIILVGDSDQLPSVGAGNVLGDIIASGRVPVVRLARIFRQSQVSDIVKNAHKIISGEKPTLNNNSNDFFFIKTSDPRVVAEQTVDLATRRLPAAYGYSAHDNIQILCPSKKMTCGSVNLNLVLQEAVNPPEKNKKQLFFKGINFRVGDKVMQTKNDYDITWTAASGEVGTGVFNGDIGVIADIDAKNKAIMVQYEDKTATYFEDNLDILDLAFAITVHKSQGSEFDCVIVPLCDTPKMLRYRNLIYTAVTRAKKTIVFVGQEDILYEMIRNDRKTLRYTGLRFMLDNYDKIY